MKKTIAILLVLVMLLSALASCKKKGNTDTNPKDKTKTSDEGRLAELGSRDCKGDTFTILDANDYPDMHVNFATEETKADSRTNEALYNRDLWLMATYNLDDVKYVSKTKAVEGMNAIRNQSLTGDLEYDMVISTAVGQTAVGAGGGTLASLAIQGMLKNLNDVDYLSLDKKWWSPLIYENMLLNDRIYFTTGDIAPSVYQAPAAMYVNVRLFSNYYPEIGEEGLFEIVEDGDWTMEKLLELTTDLSRDVDENNIWNASTDFFGLITAKNGLAVQNFVIGEGLSFSTIENNNLKMDLSSSTLKDVIDDIAKIYPKNFEYGGSGNPSVDQQRVINVTFKGGNAVFLAHQLEAAMFHLRDMVDTYDVLPQPKNNANQKQYLSLVNNWCDCFVAVPSAVMDARMDFVGFMMEAMAAYSNDKLRPLIYETVLQTQRVENEQSAAMIRVIMDGIVIDYAITYDIAGLQDMVLQAATGESSLKVKAKMKENEINSAIKEIMKAHGIETDS